MEAAADQLIQRGWMVDRWPVDFTGMLRLDGLEALLEPPTRLVSLIWGQSEVGTVQPLLSVAAACRERGIVLHTDATQLIPQGLIDWSPHPSICSVALPTNSRALGGWACCCIDRG